MHPPSPGFPSPSNTQFFSHVSLNPSTHMVYKNKCSSFFSFKIFPSKVPCKRKKKKKSEKNKREKKRKKRGIAPCSQVSKYSKERDLSNKEPHSRPYSSSTKSTTCVCFLHQHESIFSLAPKHSPTIEIRNGTILIGLIFGSTIHRA